MPQVKWTVAFLSILALVATLSPAYAGGGAGCDAAKAAKTADGGQETHGKAHAAKAEKLAAKGWLGIDTKKDEASGVVVVKSVAAGSPAEAAGFRTGDVLVSLNGIALTAENKESLKKAKSQLGVGKAVS
ncbi:MAG TPA: PDZ domain-containing protein [Thermoanaerobaculia bacterium]|nr:PDZ domain-containing protein [Thermoanaerobaculia bacterium]